MATDATQTLEGEQCEIVVHGKKVLLQNGKLRDSADRLSGAYISMKECVKI